MMRHPNKYTTFGMYVESVISPITEDGKKYYEIVFLQQRDGIKPLEILREEGKDAALEYLKQYDYGKELDHSPVEAPWGDDDETYEKDGYVMSWSAELGYIGLVREVKKEEPPAEEPVPTAAPEATPEPGSEETPS